MDGTASLNMYELKEIPTMERTIEVDTSNFITRGEFEETMSWIKNYLESFASASRESAAANVQVTEKPVQQESAPKRSFDF